MNDVHKQDFWCKTHDVVGSFYTRVERAYAGCPFCLINEVDRLRKERQSEQDADDCEHVWGYRQGGFLLHCVKCGAIEENAMTEKNSG